MSIAGYETREERIEWLLRPTEWAYSLSFFAAVFGFFFWYFALVPTEITCVMLILVAAANMVLALWSVSRLGRATRAS